MPKIISRKPQPALEDRVVTALRAGLKTAGFPVTAIVAEPLKGTKLFRVTLIAKGLEKIWFTERQDLVWRILHQSISNSEQLRISMVVALAPKEAVAVKVRERNGKGNVARRSRSKMAHA